MNILAFCPQSRVIEHSLASINALNVDGHDLAWVFASSPPVPLAERWAEVTGKYRYARKLVLENDYDALFCVEDDQVIPPDALVKLAALDTDIAYGLCVTRRDPHLWSASIRCGPSDTDYVSYDMRYEAMREAWGRVIPVIGCGLFCTLIKRHVLERVPFELRGTRCCDYYAAYDWHKAGFEQLCDTSLLCGHVMEDSRVVWPDGEKRYRIEEMESVPV